MRELKGRQFAGEKQALKNNGLLIQSPPQATELGLMDQETLVGGVTQPLGIIPPKE
jgi:hypothetical protein